MNTTDSSGLGGVADAIAAVIAVAALSLISSACGSQELAPTASSIQANIFNVHCAISGCHVGPAPESGLVLEPHTAMENLVGVPSVGIPERLRVAPGNPKDSYLIDKLRGNQIVGERMPMGRAPLPDSLIETIESWILAGAPP